MATLAPTTILVASGDMCSPREFARISRVGGSYQVNGQYTWRKSRRTTATKQDAFWMLSPEEHTPIRKHDLQQNTFVQFPANLTETLCKGDMRPQTCTGGAWAAQRRLNLQNWHFFYWCPVVLMRETPA